MSLDIDISGHKENSKKVALTGRLDTNTSPKLEEQLNTFLNYSVNLLIFDMTNLDYISSAGLRVFIKTRKRMNEWAGRIMMVNLQPQVKKVFDIIKALPDTPVFTSFDEMDDYLDHIQQEVVSKKQS